MYILHSVAIAPDTSVCLLYSVRTHSGRSAGVEAIITKSLEEGRLSHAGVPNQDDLEEAVGRRRTAFHLGKQEAR